MPINFLWIINLIQENVNSLIVILLGTVSVVPMDVHQVGDGLLLHRGIIHVVLDIKVTDSLKEGLIRNTNSLRPNPFKVLDEALPRPTIPKVTTVTLSLIVFVQLLKAVDQCTLIYNMNDHRIVICVKFRFQIRDDLEGLGTGAIQLQDNPIMIGC